MQAGLGHDLFMFYGRLWFFCYHLVEPTTGKEKSSFVSEEKEAFVWVPLPAGSLQLDPTKLNTLKGRKINLGSPDSC